MSNAIAFDTLKFARRLEAAGFTVQQAEALADEQAALIDERLATKQDLEELRLAMKRDLKELEYKLTIRTGGMLVVVVGVLAAMKFFG